MGVNRPGVDAGGVVVYTVGVRLLRQPEFYIIVAAAGVLTAGHYTASTHDPFWHDLFRRLYYLPIILAGFRYGLKGGFVTAVAISVVFLPHVLMTRTMLHVQAMEARFEIPLYLAVGVVTGILAGRQRRTDAALRRAEKLKTLGETAAGMAHEVKNPLAAIRSSAQLLADGARRDGAPAPGRTAELARIIVAEADRVNEVVSDFLQYARPASPTFEPVQMSELLESCAALLATDAAGKGVGFTRSYPADEPSVTADPGQLRQVLLNLVLNAVQASPAGAEVSLAVRVAGRKVRVEVGDHGPGIPADRLKHVFEPFYTTREGGTGLGLSVAQRIVADHGGSLAIRSEPGHGTVATVELSKK